MAEVIGLSAALALSAVALMLLTPDRAVAQVPSATWTTALILLAFGLSLLIVIRIQFRHDAVLFSASEIPFLFALVYLAPFEALAVRLLASAFVYVTIKRSPAHKILFNLAMFASELAIAYFVMRSILPIDEMSDSAIVLVAAGSVAIGEVWGSVAVSLAVSLFVGDTFRHIVDELKSAWVLLVNVALAGILLSTYMIAPSLAAFAIVPVGAMWFMMRRYGELAQRLRDLRAVHGFAGRVGRSLEMADIGTAAVSETSHLLRAQVSVLAVFGTDQPARVFATGPLPDTIGGRVDAEYWKQLPDPSEATLVTGETLATWGITDFAALGDVIVAPVDDEIGGIGLLIAGRQRSARRAFDQDDVSRVQNLADQLASSLRKGMLHRRIEFEARHDALTGLPNRVAFERELEVVSSAHQDADRRAYLLMMDLDRFKEVNDTLGHHAGDDLLIEFSRRVADSIGPDDFLCRLAGDEFAVLVHAHDQAEVFELARSCIEHAGRPVVLDGLSIVITASVGVAVIEPGKTDPQKALRHADIAMYNAKSRHVGVEFYRPELDRRTPARLSMLGDLRDAIENEELGIEYQPKLDLATGLITGVEALVRWSHIARGVVPPAEFVRVAEDTGLIKRLTDLMLSRGIVELARWHEQGHHLSLSVNLSTHDLLDANLATRVRTYLGDSDVDPGALTLEITESSLLIDAPRTQATIHDLNQLGVRLSIDDFGTGYSSLSYLRQLPVRELKVDQSFIANMLVDQQDEVIVRSTIDLGHNLGLEVVAEGVESDPVLEKLREFGCDVAQGFCVSRPLTAARLQTWLNTTHHPIRRVNLLRPDSWALDVAGELDDVDPDVAANG
ncbi:EAL domain-containing protein [Ilumatobacter sp.]|uniref:EAL domain-containing protein n=1 Tax=Ilumatobacter sp. TaxID=1967498 RepID=UPI003B529A81